MVIAMRARFTKKRFPAGALAALLVLAAGPALLRAQETPAAGDRAFVESQAVVESQDFVEGQAAVEGQAGHGASPSGLTAPSSAAPVFEVLEVTTGSGSRSRKDRSALEIEIIDLTPKSPEDAARAALAEAEADPGLTPAQREAKAREAALETALELWRSQTLNDYSYNIFSLQDPFMPIREVRGGPDSGAGAPLSGDAVSLPPILRVELNQLKLVAITTRSGAGLNSALASFEDGAGASYIIRRGDRIGRRQGRVVDITPDTVTVEEAAPNPGAPSRVTEIKLRAAAASSEAAAVLP